MSGSGSRVERPDYVKRSAEKGVCHCCHARLGTGARRGVHYRDERACCERCRASAVTRITEGRPILQRVARDLKDLAGLDFEEVSGFAWNCAARPSSSRPRPSATPGARVNTDEDCPTFTDLECPLNADMDVL